ncbi:MAG: 1,4-dihydroxy-2-naphthoate octaprenyltransferase [Bacteroidales bacterium]|nr:1,4-dihydroxy-2-naphthoate octaprenyltransferase [Bacteroidales bacterium]
MISAWIEAMRLRTLPVSIAGVVTAIALAVARDVFAWIPAMLCLAVALLAQIASNFANEYFDYRNGLDRPGREGPRRGVTEGDISPSSMLFATFLTLALACAAGLCLVAYSGWWLVLVGAAVALGVFAYSAGPYPLSHHGLGEVAVLLFFGLIPVNFTYYLMSGQWSWTVFGASMAIGLMGANVLIVNNYRDYDDDRAVGKHTIVVLFGRRVAAGIYLVNGVVALLALWGVWEMFGWWSPLPAMAYLVGHLMLWRRLTTLRGAALTRVLAGTSMLMFLEALLLLWLAMALKG